MRKRGPEFTKLMNLQYEELRRQHHSELAADILDVVGVHQVNGRPYVVVADLEAHEPELMQLAGRLKAWFTSTERHALYGSNVRLGVAIAKVALRAVGCPLDETKADIDGSVLSVLSIE